MVLGMRLGGMEENKKSGGGDVRAKALSWDIEWKKAKNVFFGFFPLSPTVARCARHSHPSPPEEKAASRKKSRLRRKKTVPIACRIVSCSSTVAVGACNGGDCHREWIQPLVGAQYFAPAHLLCCLIESCAWITWRCHGYTFQTML